ncbi:hypothetical protein RhiirC2_793872 [Rhizophagus irregularis]|uniref:BED-type domain-containing protein n=1 Tax=Rhizophagus irregularis TaxID=588596 RepID=A0A2N1MEL5_9GLOM|nr:hypothetical protein RhiirC2_793872 [Rhizophagus irregularis]
MADSETDQEEMEKEIDEENNGDESEVSEVEEDEENDTRSSSRNTNKRSWVWGHFKYEDSLKKAKCDYYEENNGDESEVSEVEEDEENDTRLSSRNTNKRSWIWGHFKYENSLKKAKCDYCKSLICCNKGSTTGLLNYLKSKHNIIKNQEKNQLTIHKVINNSEMAGHLQTTYLF